MSSLKNFLVTSHGRLWNALACLLYGKKVFTKSLVPHNTKVSSISIPQKFYDRIEQYKHVTEDITRNQKNSIFYLEEDGSLTPVDAIAGIKINFSGFGNTVILSKKCTITNSKVTLGSNMLFIIEESPYLIDNFYISAQYTTGGCVIVSKNFSCHGVHITSEEGRSVFIDEDDMFSYGINIWNTDGHAIFNKNGECINFGRDVYIGKHVWVGHGVEILKGTYIPDNCAVGAGSVVSSMFDEQNCILAGKPARIIKREIAWDRKSPAYFS